MTEEQKVKRVDEQQAGEAVLLPHEYLIEGVRKSVSELQRQMAEERKKYGGSYNWKNIYEEFGRRFGFNDPEKIWSEFELVFEKKSRQPSEIRKVIELIGDQARLHAAQKLFAEQQARQEKK